MQWSKSPPAAGLPSVHPLAVGVVESGTPLRFAGFEHAFEGREEFVGCEQTRGAETRIGKISAAAQEQGEPRGRILGGFSHGGSRLKLVRYCDTGRPGRRTQDVLDLAQTPRDVGIRRRERGIGEVCRGHRDHEFAAGDCAARRT